MTTTDDNDNDNMPCIVYLAVTETDKFTESQRALLISNNFPSTHIPDDMAVLYPLSYPSLLHCSSIREAQH